MLYRLFVAINLPKNIKDRLREYQQDQKIKFNSINSELLGSFNSKELVGWTQPKNLHLTLSFLGSVKNNDLETIFSLTKQQAEKCLPFKFRLNKIVYAPPGEALPRMIWVMVDDTPELRELKQKLDTSLKKASSLSFSLEKKEKFCPHITLARFKTVAWRRVDPEERPLIEESLDLSFEVDSIEVMESVLTQTGPNYKIIRGFSLGV